MIARSRGSACLLAILALTVVMLCPGYGAKPGDPTLGQRATHALTDRDLDAAISLFQRWLDADPNQPVDWYNYACALALRGESMRAVEALRNAVAAGYHNAEWTLQDPDLMSVRLLPEFKEIVSEMTRRAQEDEHARSLLLRMPQTRLGAYLLELPDAHVPEDRRLPLCILLHGRGGDPQRFRAMIERLRLPEMIYAVPEAPYTVPERPGGFQYWPEESRGDLGAPGAVHASLLGAQWLRDLVDEIVQHHPVDPSKVFLVGFSQGAAMSYVAALEHPRLFAGVAPLGGWIPQSHGDPQRLKELASHGVSLFIGHGRTDGVVGSEAAETAHRRALEAGVDSRLMLYPTGHEIPDAMVDDLRTWLMEVCERRK